MRRAFGNHGSTLILVLAPVWSCYLGACSTDEDPGAAQVIRIRAAEDLRIGAAEGAPELTFGRISGIASDSLGRIVVIDRQANEVRLFHPDGRHAFTFGREGGGPGELRRPCCPAFAPDGLLWIRDGGNRRYGAFLVGDSTAEARGQVRMEHGDVNRSVTTTFGAEGALIDVGSGVDSAGQHVWMVRYSRSRDDGPLRKLAVREPPAESLSVHEVPREIPGGRAVFFYHQPYGPGHEVAQGPRGEWAQAVTSRYAVAWRAEDGTLIRTIARDVAGPLLSAAERERADSSLAEDSRQARQRLPFGVPERKPPIRHMYFDATGRLWVERSVADGAPREADVWSRDGRLLFTLEWPAEANCADGWRGATTALCIARDELGVERVVRFRWE